MPKVKLNTNQITQADLLTIEEVREKLGAGYSPSSIRRKIRTGVYQQGVHYFRTGGNSGIIKLYLPALQQNLIDINS